MDILIRYGFSIEEIKNMMDTNESIETTDDNNILEIINLLSSLGCHEEHIMNIFICNPFVLSKDINNIKSLIDKLMEIGIEDISTLLDINPYLLNLNGEDISSIYQKKEVEGLSKEEIIEFFNYNIILEG